MATIQDAEGVIALTIEPSVGGRFRVTLDVVGEETSIWSEFDAEALRALL